MRKIKVKFMILCSLAAFGFSSCTSLNGDEEDIQETVIELCKQELRDQLVKEILRNDYHTTHLYGSPKYNDLRENMDDEVDILYSAQETSDKNGIYVELVKFTEKN